MGKESTNLPTESELRILNVLWEQGPSTVRDVHDVMNQTRQTGYTTVLKLMQIMAEKKLVTRDESSRTHVYSAAFSQQKVQRRLVQDLLKKAFGGSPLQLANALFEPEDLTRAEFENLRNDILALREKEDGNNGDQLD